jgi:hypothetical protein
MFEILHVATAQDLTKGTPRDLADACIIGWLLLGVCTYMRGTPSHRINTWQYIQCFSLAM